jgi:hypothetical protein
MKIKVLKPSVGMMRLWIASIVIVFIITLDESFNAYSYFNYIFLELFSFINKIIFQFIELLFPKYNVTFNKWDDLIIRFFHAFSATLVYVITSAIAYLMVMWVKEGFSKSKDGN